MLLKVFSLVFIPVTILAQINPNRLPSDVYPIAYDLWIDTQNAFVNRTFKGKVEIELNVRAETKQFTINAFELDVKLVTLSEVQGGDRKEIPIEVEETYAFEQIDVIMTNVDDAFAVGKTYILTIDYEGWVNNIGVGLFIKGYSPFSVLTTNFAPISARQAFPCYDEPKFKALFTLTLVHASKYSAISNFPIATNTAINDVTTTSFETTQMLSPHSLGFVVTDFESLKYDQNNKYVAYYDQAHVKEEVSVALEASAKILNALETYLDTEVAVPEIKDIPQFDYTYLKIGSLGLVLNDMRYYYINSTSTFFQYDEVIRHVSRLMANQFFGNVIAAEWWNDVWITQGLSKFLEYYIMETEYPEFKGKDNFMVQLYSKFYEGIFVYREVDMVDLTRNLIIDPYEWKSAAIIFTMSNFMTETVFQLALRTILIEYRNAPINTELFFDILTRVAHEQEVLPASFNLNTLMETWILSESSPILEVTRDYETGIVKLKQGDYFDYIQAGYTDEGAIWWIPYNFITQNGDFTWDTLPNGWMENERTKELNFGGDLQSDEWILFNVKQTAFYHTIYDHKNWILLAKQLSTDFEKIHYINRGHLVSDAFKFSYLDFISIDVAFEIANYLHEENSTFPFRILFTEEFDTIVDNLFGTSVYANFTLFMANKIGNMYDRVRVSRDVTELSYDELSLRARLTKFACKMHLEACLEDAYTVFLKYYKKKDDEIISQLKVDYEADLGYTLFKYGFILASEEEFNYMFNRINTGSESWTLHDYAQVIGMTQNQLFIDLLMNILITKNGNPIYQYTINLAHDVRKFLFSTMVENSEYALDAALLYLRDKYTEMDDVYGWDRIELVKYAAVGITTPERLEKLLRVADIYTIEFYENFEYEIESTNRTIVWNTEKIGVFQDVLSRLLEEEDTVPTESPGDAASIYINLFTLVIAAILVIYSNH